MCQEKPLQASGIPLPIRPTELLLSSVKSACTLSYLDFALRLPFLTQLPFTT